MLAKIATLKTAEIGLAERNRSGGKVLPHAATELLKQRGIDLDGLR